MSSESPGFVKGSPDGGGADGDDALIDHHESEPPVSLMRVSFLEVEDGLFLPGLEPEVARGLGVVLVGHAVAFAPVVELALGDAEPADEA